MKEAGFHNGYVENDEILDFITHWSELSIAERHAMLALAKEIDTASHLMEASVGNLSTSFLTLAQMCSQQQKLLKELQQSSSEKNERLDESLKNAEDMSAAIQDIVTKMQFQDRSNQRLEQISATLQVMSKLNENMEKTSSKFVPEGKSRKTKSEWINDMIKDMHLEEMRERFVRHALLDDIERLFDEDQDDRVTADFSEASDDIELF